MDWLNKTIAREFGETTPISIPRLAIVNADTMRIKLKYPQFTGTPALKTGPAVAVIRIETIMICTKLLKIGIVMIERAGTPLILKLRKIPDSRASTIGFGKPNKVHAIIPTRIIAGIIVGAKVGLSPVINSPIKT